MLSEMLDSKLSYFLDASPAVDALTGTLHALDAKVAALASSFTVFRAPRDTEQAGGCTAEATTPGHGPDLGSSSSSMPEQKGAAKKTLEGAVEALSFGSPSSSSEQTGAARNTLDGVATTGACTTSLRALSPASLVVAAEANLLRVRARIKAEADERARRRNKGAT
jgi:hypothetical protein